MTTNLEFETVGDWSLQGSNKKKLYISFVTKIDGWKKNVVFYRADIGEEAFTFLLHQFAIEEPRAGWTFAVATRGRWMNSIFANHIRWIKDAQGKMVFKGKKTKGEDKD